MRTCTRREFMALTAAGTAAAALRVGAADIPEALTAYVLDYE